jgi:hypothetical protein
MFNDDIVLQINVAFAVIFFLLRLLFEIFFQPSEFCDKWGNITIIWGLSGALNENKTAT